MSHIAWSVCLFVGHTDVLCTNGWTDRDAVSGRTDSCGSKELCIRWGQGRTNPFAFARGDKTTMLPFVTFFDQLLLLFWYSLATILLFTCLLWSTDEICSWFRTQTNTVFV